MGACDIGLNILDTAQDRTYHLRQYLARHNYAYKFSDVHSNISIFRQSENHNFPQPRPFKTDLLESGVVLLALHDGNFS